MLLMGTKTATLKVLWFLQRDDLTVTDMRDMQGAITARYGIFIGNWHARDVGILAFLPGTSMIIKNCR